jgi:CelD/BcsL family acetyltransferase involved in cellulose biosynthesis
VTDMIPLKITALKGIDGILANRASWDACVAATGGDIYFTADWIAAWWAHFSANRRLLPLCLWRGQELVGVLALCIEVFWLGPVPVRMARLAGMDPNYPILGLPLPPGQEDEALQLVFSEALTHQGCVGLSLSPISDLATATAPIRQAAGTLGLPLAADVADRQHTVMHLPETFDAYFAALSKSRRREYRKDLSKLEERHRLDNRTSVPETVEARLQAFIKLHTDQWQAIGKAGHFGDWPGSAAFYADVTSRLATSGRATLEEHCADGTPLSTQLAFRQGARAYWRLIARTLDPELVQFGVGRVGLVERVRLLIGDGVRLVEAAAGEYDYKLDYGGELVGMRRMIIGAPRFHARIRLWLLLAWSDLLNLLYYRVWFLKLAPRLRKVTGGQPRPLWRSWIRSRL